MQTNNRLLVLVTPGLSHQKKPKKSIGEPSEDAQVKRTMLKRAVSARVFSPGFAGFPSIEYLAC
jgi:hypothetical protein